MQIVTTLARINQTSGAAASVRSDATTGSTASRPEDGADDPGTTSGGTAAPAPDCGFLDADGMTSKQVERVLAWMAGHVEREREACAKVCEEMSGLCAEPSALPFAMGWDISGAIDECARRIREMGKK